MKVIVFKEKSAKIINSTSEFYKKTEEWPQSIPTTDVSESM